MFVIKLINAQCCQELINISVVGKLDCQLSIGDKYTSTVLNMLN